MGKPCGLTAYELDLLVVAAQNWKLKGAPTPIGEHLAPTSLGEFVKMHNVYLYEVVA